jgi:hypothetical protein
VLKQANGLMSGTQSVDAGIAATGIGVRDDLPEKAPSGPNSGKKGGANGQQHCCQAGRAPRSEPDRTVSAGKPAHKRQRRLRARGPILIPEGYFNKLLSRLLGALRRPTSQRMPNMPAPLWRMNSGCHAPHSLAQFSQGKQPATAVPTARRLLSRLWIL